MNNRCIVCGNSFHKTPIITCEKMPKSAQKFSNIQNADDTTVTLSLKQCSGCGLVQLDIEPVYYYRDVIRSGAYSSTMHFLRHEQYARFIKLCHLENKRIIEIGCGQGEFLRIWREDGFPVKAYGIENDPELVKKAVDDRLKVFKGFAEKEDTVLEGAPFDGFCCFNYLEHQPDPNGMLRCIYNNLKEKAYGLITVPSLEYIIEKESYYELIRDHIAYYSKETLCFLIEKNGFKVLNCRLINNDTWEAIIEKKELINAQGLKNNKDNLKTEINNLFSQLKSQNKQIAIWGASHQGLTILSSLSLSKYVNYVVDSAPFKQGKYTISSGVPIVSPSYIKDHTVDVILIIAPGYSEEISELIKKTDKSIIIYSLRGNHLEICN